MKRYQQNKSNNDLAFVVTIGLCYILSIITIYFNYKILCNKFGKFLEWVDEMMTILEDNQCHFILIVLSSFITLIILTNVLDTILEIEKNKLRLKEYNIIMEENYNDKRKRRYR